MLHSSYRSLSTVVLPWANRQFYMHGFDISNPKMPEGFEDYQEIVCGLLTDSNTFSGKAYMTVDEKIVQSGQSQRRPKPHVDGCFREDRNRWGHPGWNHTCNNVPVDRMPVIVAASVVGCMVWQGSFGVSPTDSGDLSHIEDQLFDGELLSANRGYLLSPDCIHESLVFDKNTQRSFLRIALPPLIPLS